MIDAAQTAFFVAAKEQRGAAMRASMIQYANMPQAVAKSDQTLAQQHEAQWVAIGCEFRRQAGRQPVLTHQRAHRGATQRRVAAARGACVAHALGGRVWTALQVEGACVALIGSLAERLPGALA